MTAKPSCYLHLDQYVSWIDGYEHGTCCYTSMVQETNSMLFVPQQGEEYL
jgi:hypothetical protein